MELILESQAKILREQHDQYSASELSDLIVPVKLFGPHTNWKWYLLTQDPNDPDYLWAIVDGFAVEMGSVSLAELQEQQIAGIPAIERDIHCEPVNAKELWDGLINKGE